MFKARRINGSWLLSLVLAVCVAAFLISADVVDINATAAVPASKPEPGIASETKEPFPYVHAVVFQQQLTPRTLTLYGRTEADRVITISAEIPARVTKVGAERGQILTAGQEIVRLREGSLQARLKFAKAKLKLAQQEYQSALSLRKKNHIPENTLTQREVAVAEAESSLDELQFQWDNTRIKAPVSGILNERHVELGDFIDKGKPVAEILDLDPLVVTIDVPQIDISEFSLNDKASVRFISGETRPAQIRYIDRQADAATRTFSVELSLPNPDMTLPAGLSVEADLIMNRVMAIEVTPALLALSASGEPGIKWVDDSDQVQFSAVDIVKSGSNSLWLTGIPEQARIITRGQGFVRIGDQVTVVETRAVETRAVETRAVETRAVENNIVAGE